MRDIFSLNVAFIRYFSGAFNFCLFDLISRTPHVLPFLSVSGSEYTQYIFWVFSFSTAAKQFLAKKLFFDETYAYHFGFSGGSIGPLAA